MNTLSASRKTRALRKTAPWSPTQARRRDARRRTSASSRHPARRTTSGGARSTSRATNTRFKSTASARSTTSTLATVSTASTASRAGTRSTASRSASSARGLITRFSCTPCSSARRGGAGQLRRARFRHLQCAAPSRPTGSPPAWPRRQVSTLTSRTRNWSSSAPNTPAK